MHPICTYPLHFPGNEGYHKTLYKPNTKTAYPHQYSPPFPNPANPMTQPPRPPSASSTSSSSVSSISSSQISSIYDDRFDDSEDDIPQPRLSTHYSNQTRPRRPRSLGIPPATLPSPPEVARTINHPLHYAFAQAFGEPFDQTTNFVHEADILSAVSFNHSADVIAAGDKGGRIMLLKRGQTGDGSQTAEEPFSAVCLQTYPTIYRRRGRRKVRVRGSIDYTVPMEGPYQQDVHLDSNGDRAEARPPQPQFRFWTQFQSHEPEFDYLKSMEIEEKINHIRWCRQTSGAQRLIATNDKTIKLWRISDKDVKTTAVMDPASLLPKSDVSRTSPRALSSILDFEHRLGIPPPSVASNYHPSKHELRIPSMEVRKQVIVASPRKIFSNAHAYHINSISINNDEETVLSCDDLRVNLWNLNAGGIGFNILDIKPGHLEDLTEVITSAEFHPQHCHLFMHSSSRGIVKLCDLRQSALCQSWAREFAKPRASEIRASFFSEIVASISSMKFSPCGRYILTRDFMNMRLWDIHMETQPILLIPVHEHLRYRLCDLYDNDCIFDKFQCCFSNDGGSVMTGSYNSMFHSYSAYSGVGVAVEANADFVTGVSGRYHFTPQGYSTIGNDVRHCSAAELADPTKRIMYVDGSTTEPIAAAAAGAALYIYSQRPGRRRY